MTSLYHSEEMPPRPDVLDSDTLGIMVGKVLEHSGRTAYEERAELTERLETQIYETQELCFDDLRDVIKEFFKAKRWRWTKRMEAFLSEVSFRKLLHESHDEAQIIWVEGYGVLPKYTQGIRVAFLVDKVRHFGAIRGIDHQRGLYVLEVDPKKKDVFDSFRSVRKRNKLHILLPYETVHMAMTELQYYN